MKTQLGDWVIEAFVDDDGFLTIAINHNDGSRVLGCEVDIAVNDVEWSDRFTTEAIEVAYRKELT